MEIFKKRTLDDLCSVSCFAREEYQYFMRFRDCLPAKKINSILCIWLEKADVGYRQHCKENTFKY